ncbi:MAG: LysR family transcriptional regulator [Clostridiales bacterium]|nr:LysR family transcriptional regulator [Clostridiales bacterium]
MNYRKQIDLRQIECFVACAQTGSVSKASQMLHMSQPSVSKAIKAMEETLEVRLFHRYAKGILLTAEGKSVYQYARNITDNLREMQTIPAESKIDTLHLSCNPSSWFSDTFLEFYTAHQEENLHYEVVSAGTRDIVRRLEERIDDVGFVYVIKNQKPDFLQYLMRNYLEFTELAQTSVMLFSGESEKRGSEPGDRSEDGELAQMDSVADGLAGLRLVQRFPDEFSPDNYWDVIDSNGRSIEAAETVVTTNSEYIMSRLLQAGNLSNISAAYLTSPQNGVVAGTPIAGLKEDRIIFGYVKRRGEELPVRAEEFVEYVKHKIETES